MPKESNVRLIIGQVILSEFHDLDNENSFELYNFCIAHLDYANLLYIDWYGNFWNLNISLNVSRLITRLCKLRVMHIRQ